MMYSRCVSITQQVRSKDAGNVFVDFTSVLQPTTGNKKIIVCSSSQKQREHNEPDKRLTFSSCADQR